MMCCTNLAVFFEKIDELQTKMLSQKVNKAEGYYMENFIYDSVLSRL